MIWITYRNSPFMCANLQKSMLHFFICCHFKIQNIMREFSTIRHLLLFRRFRQYIESSTIPKFEFNFIFKRYVNDWHFFSKITSKWQYFKITEIVALDVKKIEEKWKCKRFYCPKKIESSYWSLNLEIALVLWCAASDLKMEVKSMISIKFCLCQWSLE